MAYAAPAWLPWEDLDRLVLPVAGRQLAAVAQVGRLGADPGPLAARAARAVEAVAEVVPCDAVGLSAWDPVRGRHRPVVAAGLPGPAPGSARGAAEAEGDPFFDDPGYRYVRARRTPLRRCDVPGAAENAFVADVLVPAGLAEGVTACLFAADGRYTGVLNLGLRREEPVGVEAMALLTVMLAGLAQLVDVTRDAAAAAAALDPALPAALVGVDGRCTPLPGRPDCPLLRPGAPVLAEAWRRRPRDDGSSAFLWHDEEDGALWRVLVVRPGGGALERGTLLVAASPTEVPLSLRELQVLTALAEGGSNPAIAERLAIGRRTVATHVEHLLAKLGVASRAEAAARATRDGLLLGGPGSVR